MSSLKSDLREATMKALSAGSVLKEGEKFGSYLGDEEIQLHFTSECSPSEMVGFKESSSLIDDYSNRRTFGMTGRLTCECGKFGYILFIRSITITDIIRGLLEDEED